MTAPIIVSAGPPRSLRRMRRGIGFISLVVGAAVWEVAGRLADASFLAPFSATLLRLWEMTLSGEMLQALSGSAALFGLGLGISVAVGIPLGLLIARSRRLRIAVEGYITVLYSIPMIALIPFVLSMFGFGLGPKVIVVVLFAIFPVLYNTIEGARSISQDYLDVARAFRSGEWQLWRDVLLPYTVPFALAGIRQAIGRALVGVIAAEMFLGASGIGALIASTSQNFDMPGLLATILVVTLIGVGMMAAGEQLEKNVLVWKGRDRE